VRAPAWSDDEDIAGAAVFLLAAGVAAPNLFFHRSSARNLQHRSSRLRAVFEPPLEAFWESCRRKQAAAKDSRVEWLSFRATDADDDRRAFPLWGTLDVTAMTMTTFKDPVGSRHTIRDATYWIDVGADAEYRTPWKREEYRAYSAHRCPPSS
jgi:hypothetical protein